MRADTSAERSGPNAAPPSGTELTILNMMASADFDESIALHQQWGLRWMDLWGDIYGRPSVDLLDEPTAARAGTAVRNACLQVYCLSTRIFDDDVEQGEASFRAKHLAQLARSLRVAEHLEPRVVRLIAGRLSKADPAANAVEALERDHPWVADVYREAVAAIRAAGHVATIENETHDCFLGTPDEF